MGKKGKKKATITGTRDVVKYKQQREWWLLQEIVVCQESMPYLRTDALDEATRKKASRFLNMAGLLAEHLQVKGQDGEPTKKDYRFSHHPKYMFPTPQFYPLGYDFSVVRWARQIQEGADVAFNGKTYTFPEGMTNKSAAFLREVDTQMTRISSTIESHISKDFPHGLKHYKYELKEQLEIFDAVWVTYEEEMLKERKAILDQVFEPVDKLVMCELQLSQAEDRLDIEAKQRLENEFVSTIEEFTHTVLPETTSEQFPDDVIPLAEACIFYEAEESEMEALLPAKHALKEYLDLRVYIQKIPEERLKPDLKENKQFIKLLSNFHAAVIAAKEALDYVAKLPTLIHAKTDKWMTKKLLEPDLRYIHKTAQAALDLAA
eukprot:TRINITY_DN76674_c0_g1_i1.p1 TRINITY_DN76674_c0_g1~~TRINITY_DN76674_c0_g1_i1.p1  ORF type:complete len:376 (-),score=100.66 TRINITY_DN76674_c0_g1_i1:212-1339(-)